MHVYVYVHIVYIHAFMHAYMQIHMYVHVPKNDCLAWFSEYKMNFDLFVLVQVLQARGWVARMYLTPTARVTTAAVLSKCVILNFVGRACMYIYIHIYI